MNPEEARLELDVTTLRPQDASAEARALTEKDAALGTWVEQRTVFDEKVAAAMNDIPVPDALHAKLAGIAQQAAAKKRRAMMMHGVVWLSAAAVVMFASVHLWFDHAKAKGWQSEALANVQLVEHGMSPLQHRSPSLDEVKKMLAVEGSLVPVTVPAALAKLRTYGCRTVKLAGQPATIICFQLSPGKEAHLVVMNAADLSGPPPQKSPVFSKDGSWSMAAWSDGSQSFLLATSAGETMLRKLFDA